MDASTAHDPQIANAVCQIDLEEAYELAERLSKTNRFDNGGMKVVTGYDEALGKIHIVFCPIGDALVLKAA